ncbi:pentatricopeptide repeat-containing protein At2g20710, mitochondrial isoform X2 [Eutrema salsugineum]|uniref:pentatricopeptide repeat-containing protein At2g20710, mitochondrial isoform X2 n=1 Tax=Eutrema salsugineum TaxID=72664 RepID=UPI000CECF1FB|nr:pentatricopeptide repeat-containing protein At2g20710, mitochondrial isoform X2 [Eutrema salsugineum]
MVRTRKSSETCRTQEHHHLSAPSRPLLPRPPGLFISEWMSDQKGYNLSTVDFEIRLLLIAKVRGLEEADRFLDTIPLKKRDFYVHSALLNACKTHSSLSIAETTFQKMRDLGFAANNSKPYNTMLFLYHQAENHDMVIKLLRDMDHNNMEPEGIPFGKLLSSYAIASIKDVEGMENFLSKWEKRMEPWTTCFFPAFLHLQLGSREKGLALLRRTEELVEDASRETIYGCLMTAYCQEGEREDVIRLLNLAKAHGISFDSFKCSEIIKAFTTKGDLDTAHEVMEEWDTGAGDLGLADFGHRKRYVKEEADKVLNMLGKKECKWESLREKLHNLVDDREEERRKRVAEAMEGRLPNRWNPKSSMALSAYACVQYVEGRRDMESAADILRLLSKQEQVSRAMDKGRLSLKMVEAMRGGGYIGGHD